MKFTAPAIDLSRALSLAARCLTRSSIPILGCARLSARGRDLEIRVTDMERFITVSVPASISKEGETAVSAERLLWFAKDADDDVSLSLGKSASIKAGCRSVSLPALDPKEFPLFPEPKDGARISCGAAELLRLISLTEFLKDPAATTNFYHGVSLECENGKLTAMSSDGKISVMLPTEIAAPAFEPIIVPWASLIPIRAMAEQGEALELSITPDRLVVRSGTASFQTKLVDAMFPSKFFRDLMRDADDSMIVLPSATLGGAMARAAKFSEDRAHTTYMQMHGGRLYLRALSADGEFSEEIAPKGPTEDCFFAVNSVHVARVCAAFGGDITIGIKSENEPAMTWSSAHPGARIVLALCACNASHFKREAKEAA